MVTCLLFLARLTPMPTTIVERSTLENKVQLDHATESGKWKRDQHPTVQTPAVSVTCSIRRQYGRIRRQAGELELSGLPLSLSLLKKETKIDFLGWKFSITFLVG
ncbi:hypothetical protein BCR44DRAFT_1431972 [Catenaria anguillulae PL171]|uniref:Uncharacterized protein n=1 Tax=Catenaria anguillulae PL171 TaxID=765915 RepID=A0A1Y2HQT9_9FUNG|nr:hypothetical protein BCR44DRAFT_1431972 [Catenaria anguillulae PL171]